MDQLTRLEEQLKTATESHQALTNELPRFHGLLTDNEQTAERLRREKADLDEQAQARGRVNIAREMLQQHQSDIASAQQEVARLEADIDRERIILQMVEHSREAKAERSRIDKAFLHLARELQRATSTISEAWCAENEARSAFAQEGYKLMPNPNFMDISAWRNMNDQARQRAKTLEQALAERGAEIEAVKDGATGRFSFMDEYPVRELPRDEISVLLWEAIRRLTEGNTKAHNLKRLTPSRPTPSAKFEAVLQGGGVTHG